MESLPRKCKGTRSACSLARSLHDAARKRTCREHKPRPEKKATTTGAGAASSGGRVVMTALPASGAATPKSPGRGLKRKLECIESATRMGWKKRLESEYELGGEIGQGKFGSVRICCAKAEGEEFACKTLPKNGRE